MSITYKPKNKKRKRVHGFRKRMKTKPGMRILKRRRSKKRKTLAL
jgi:large subunit ribosomal protein L34